jgi:hypothetical protein
MAGELLDLFQKDLGEVLFTDFAEPLTITPANGTPYGVDGFFVEAYQEIDVSSGVPVTSTNPRARLIQRSLKAPLGPQDKITARGQVYEVIAYQPTGYCDGWATLRE